MEHAEGHVTSLVALVQPEEVAEHGLDLRLPHELEQGQRHGLDHHLHAHELLGEAARA